MQRVITQMELRGKENYKMKPPFPVWTIVVLLFTKLEQGRNKAHTEVSVSEMHTWTGRNSSVRSGLEIWTVMKS